MLIRTPLRAPEGSEGGGGADAPVVAPNPALVAPAPAAGDVPAAPSHRDWNAMAQTQRDTLRTLGEVAALLKNVVPAKPAEPPAPRAPAPVAGTEAAEIAAMRDRLALSEAIDDSGLNLTREQKETVRKLHAFDKPTDIGEWLARTATVIGAKPVAAPVVAPVVAAPAPAAPARPFDPGAPSGAPAARVPLDPMAIPQSVVDAMTPAQAKEWYDAYIASGNSRQHPFHAARQAEKNAGSTAETARQIAVALQNLQPGK